MLRVSKVRSGGGAYYLAVAAGTGTGIEPAGRWTGSGAPVLGLAGAVRSADLEAVLAGQDPGSGQVLGRGRPRVTVAGFDLTFSAPKSVSLLHALGDPEVSRAVAAGHNGAVEAALSYVERHALAVRRRTGTAPVPVPTPLDGVTAAGFVHRLSRALDPHLHSHVVVANLGRGPEGTWSALDGRGVYAHASATDALYHSHLRFELTRRLGVAWETAARGRADIAGIGPEARREFSRRAADIAAHMVEGGWAGGRARAVAAHATRADKDPSLSADELRPLWRRRAQAVGLGPTRLEAVLDRVPQRSVSPSPGSPEQAAEVRETLAARGQTVTRRDVVRAWGRALPAGASAAAVEAAADRLLGHLVPERGGRGSTRRARRGRAPPRRDGPTGAVLRPRTSPRPRRRRVVTPAGPPGPEHRQGGRPGPRARTRVRVISAAGSGPCSGLGPQASGLTRGPASP